MADPPVELTVEDVQQHRQDDPAEGFHDWQWTDRSVSGLKRVVPGHSLQLKLDLTDTIAKDKGEELYLVLG